MATKTHFFDSNYDGTSYTRVYRVDPTLLVPGIMLTILSLFLFLTPIPALTIFEFSAIGFCLSALGFLKRTRFSVSPTGYHRSWSIGPFGSSVQMSSDEATLSLTRGSKGTFMVLIHAGLRRIDPWIEVSNRSEGEAWLEFLRNVSQGIPAKIPE